MALISSGGGKLVGVSRGYTDRGTDHPLKPPHVKAPRGLRSHGWTDRGTSRPHVVAPARPQPKKKKPNPLTPYASTSVTRSPSAAAADTTQDPFDFIKGLLASTNPDDIKKLIDPIYAPLRQQVLDQITALQQSSSARATQMQQIYDEFAKYMQGMSGQMQSIYGGGDAKSQGFADGQALVGGMAGPQGDVGSHMASMAGIESSLNDSLGKTWGAWAAAQPGIYSLMATSEIKQMLGDATASETKLRQDLLDLSSKEADSILQYLEDAQGKDASLQQWAYEQKQQNDQQTAAQEAAKAKQAQDSLDYLQKQRQIDFNNAIVQHKLGITEARAQADAQYKRNLLALKRQGLITDAQYKQAQARLSQKRINVQQQNANTQKKRAALAAKTAAQKKAESDRKFRQSQRDRRVREAQFRAKQKAAAKKKKSIFGGSNYRP